MGGDSRLSGGGEEKGRVGGRMVERARGKGSKIRSLEEQGDMVLAMLAARQGR